MFNNNIVTDSIHVILKTIKLKSYIISYIHVQYMLYVIFMSLNECNEIY